MKVLIVPDSYKGSLTSKQVGSIIKSSLEEDNKDLEITALPFSDGGEGFSDCIFEICKGDMLYAECRNIFGERIKAPVVTLGDTAVIETASASGLLKRKNVMKASSYGTGELIKFAVSKGFRKIILGLGGSGCCDGGAGALAALGAVFYDESYTKINVPRGMDLNCIFGFSTRDIVKPITFTFGTDVENEYFGKNGAAYVFAPQKGANESQVKELDEGLKRLNAFFKNDVSKLKGVGAAGGICGGLYSVYGGTVKSGFDILSELSGLESRIKESDLIITGEGKTDEQTLMGKLPFKISSLAEKYGKKCVLISGEIEDVSIGDKMISLIDGETPAEYAIANAEKVLFEKAKYILQ